MAPEWAVVAYDEIFVNLNTVGTTQGKGPAAGFDQNRVLVGINADFLEISQHGHWLPKSAPQQPVDS